MVKDEIPFDIIQKIVEERDHEPSRKVDVSEDEFELDKGKRIHDKKNRTYLQNLNIDGRNYVVRWSSNKKTRKQIKNKIVERDMQTTVKPILHGYYIEKMKTADNKLWFIKYNSKAKRTKQIKRLIQNIKDNQLNYGVTSDDADRLRTISRKTDTYGRFDQRQLYDD